MTSRGGSTPIETDQSSARDLVSGFLLQEYSHLADSFWKSEESGEKRLTFFITLVAAVLSLVGALLTSNAGIASAMISTISLFALVGLLLFGLQLLLRMIKRNENTDRYKHGMVAIRRFYRGLPGSDLEDYLPFGTERPRRRKFGTGGLVESVIMFNGLSGAALAIVAADTSGMLDLWLAGAIGFVVLIAGQYLYTNGRYEKDFRNRSEGTSH